jgi:hypothetical protein
MHYIIERHREVLLESFLVYRSDANNDGVLDREGRQALLTQVQTALQQRVVRTTLQEQILAMNTANLPLPKVSNLLWSSSDGFPFTLKIPENPNKRETVDDPTPLMYTVEDAPHTRIPEFDFVHTCLSNDLLRSSLADVKLDARMLFRLFAREYPYCGDTLLAVLIPSSPTGLHHLLPPPSHPKYSEIIRQLHQYAYTISETSSKFIMAQSMEILRQGFDQALEIQKHEGLAQICVNDDVEYGSPETIKEMDVTLKGILQGYFGGLTPDRGRSPVEKVESVEEINAEGKQFWSSVNLNGGPGYN